MIKRMWFVLALVFLVATSAYAAPDRTNRWDAGLNVSAAIPDDGDTAAYVGGTASYGINNWAAVGISSGWAEFEDSDSGINVETTSVPLFGEFILRAPMEGPAQPYGVIGLGVIFWSVDDNLANVDFTIDDAFAAKFGGGVDYFLDEHWVLNFEFSFITSDPDISARNNVTGASVSANGDFDSWNVGGGIKYLF